MDEREIEAAREEAVKFAREHAQELAVELLEWSETSVLRHGRVRELAKNLEALDRHHSLKLAQSFAEHAALELAARRTTPNREAIIEECAAICKKRRDCVFPNPTSGYALGYTDCAAGCEESIRALKNAPTPSPRDTLIEEIAEMVDHMGEGRRLEEYVGAIREMKSGDKGGA